MHRKLIYGSVIVIVALGLIMVAACGRSAPASAASRQVYLAVNGANPRSATVTPRAAAISVDSSLFLQNMTWTQWGTQATGTGTAMINLCSPDCAAGNDVKVPVSVVLSDPQTVCGREFFTTMLLRLTGPVPAGMERTATVPVTPTC